MSKTIIEIKQTIYKPACATCVSIEDDKRSWTAKDYQAPRPYCKNPKSPFYMRIPPFRCHCYEEAVCTDG